jgi:uncharacterized peroxidase-related enzyme
VAYIQTVPVAEASGDVASMYRDSAATPGYVPNYAKVFSSSPGVYRAWGELLASIRDHMDLRRYELVTLAAARALRSSYCMLAHGRVLNKRFYSAPELAAIARNYRSAPLSAQDIAIMAYAEKIALDAGSVRPEDIDALRAHGLADDEIFDIAAAAAARCFFSKLLDSLGAEPDASYGELDEELRRELIMGRPISAEGVERIHV